jgi:hypothetical protein
LKKQQSNFKKRNSISLPDICATLQQQQQLEQSIKSITSTPSKLRTSSTVNTPSSKSNINRVRNNISIIIEEKENPNSILVSNLNEKSAKLQQKLKSIAVQYPKLKTECTEIEIQCNKGEEDMLMSETVENTPYWRLLAHKRYKCWTETQIENSMVSRLRNELTVFIQT